MPSSIAASYDVELHHDVAMALPAWEALETAGFSTPFQTRAWLEPWYRIVAPANGAEPLIVVVRSRATGAPLMLLPLSRTRGGSGHAIVSFAGSDVSDYIAPVVSPDFPQARADMQVIWKRIARVLGSGDCARFDKVTPEVGSRVNPLLQLVGNSRMPYSSWGFTLPPTIRSFDDDTLPKKMRKEVRRRIRRLEEKGALTYEASRTDAERSEIFAQMLRQRAARFDGLNRYNALNCDTLRSFYEAVSFEPGNADFIGLSSLRLDGEVIASLFGLHHRGGFYLVFFTITEGQYQSFSPGKVALYKAIEHEIGAGSRFFDLTIGDEPYKKQFGAQSSPLYCASHALAIRAMPRAIWLNAVGRLKEQVRDVMADAATPSLMRKALLGITARSRLRHVHQTTGAVDV